MWTLALNSIADVWLVENVGVAPSVDPTTYARDVLGEQLEGLVQAMLDHATPPVFLRHNHPVSLQVPYDRAVATIREALKLLDESERDALRAGLNWFLQDGDLAVSLVEHVTHSPYFEIPESVFDSSPHRDSQLLKILPAFPGSLDDDGLLECTNRDVTDQAVFEGDWALHYHQLLRRHFTAHINDALIGLLLETSGNETKVRLAIDDRRLRSRDEYSPYVERDYWYGPPLSEEFIDGEYSIGRTVHQAPEGDVTFDGYSRFVAIWYRDGGHNRKAVQMEEVIRLESEGSSATSHLGSSPYILLRYLHAIRDTQEHEFVHCDGAVRAYTRETYASRLQSDWSDGVRAERYRKVFRIDGHIPTATWSNIVATWFRHNRLALEYLSTLTQS